MPHGPSPWHLCRFQGRHLYRRQRSASRSHPEVSLPQVAILTTGGTIAGEWQEAQGGVVPVLSGEDLVRLTPGLSAIADLHIEKIANVDSSNMQPDVWLRLSHRVNAWLAQPDI